MAKILCIDDEPDAIKVRRYLLESHGHEVIPAMTGKEGIGLFRSHKIDLVILDYWMGGLNGIEVAKELRFINQNVPIIMLSGFIELPGESAGLVDHWILKGRTTEILLRAIRESLQRGAPVQENFRYPWQQMVADALASHRNVLLLRINSAERAIADRLTEPNLEREELAALKEALQALKQLISETKPTEYRKEKKNIA
jgi:DNA-binding response OmpR family regulator